MALSTDKLNVDITIVGGGMVGAALAALLAAANRQWQIALVETFPLPEPGEPHFQPSYDDRSTAIAHGSVELLQMAGVWPLLSQHATPIHQVHVSDKGHLGGALIEREKMKVEALGYVVPNGWIGRVLISHLQSQDNITLLAPATVTALTPVVNGVDIAIANTSSETGIATQLAIIADGASSPIRQKLGIDSDVHDYRQTAIIANVSYEQPHNGVAYERFTDEGPMAMLPLGGSTDGQQSALVWTQPQHQAEELLALSDDQFLQRLQQRFGFRLGRLTRVGKRDSYPLSLSVAKEQVRSSIAIMGNAAHFLHPVAGQGFNLALRDCATLATCLQQAGSRPLGHLSLLQQYIAQQQLDQQATIGFSDQLTRLFTSTRLPQAALRSLGFVGLECLPPVKSLLTQQTMGSAGKRVRI